MHHIPNFSRTTINMKNGGQQYEGMISNVMQKVGLFEIKRSRHQIFVFSLVSLAAVAAAVQFFLSVIDSSSQSGFSNYFSLIISDSSYVFSNWKEFVLSTASSLPLTGLIVVVLALFIFAIALKKTMKSSIHVDELKKRVVSI